MICKVEPCSTDIVCLSTAVSAEATGDVILGLPLRRLREDHFGAVVLDQVAQVHEGGVVGHARGLLHVVGHDHDGVLVLELFHQLLDAAGRDRIQRRGRLVQQQHRRAQGHGTGDAQALLLATGQAQCALPQLVLHFVPQRALAQCLLDAVGHVGLAQLLVVADAVGHVLEDGHRERHRLLEHHADLAAQAVHRVLRRQDVFAVQQHFTTRLQLRVQRVDAVEDAQQGRLAATGGTDQRGHALFRNLQVDALQGMELVVVEVQSTRSQLHRRRRVQALVRGRHGDALHRHGVGKVVHGVIHGKVSHGRYGCAAGCRGRQG